MSLNSFFSVQDPFTFKLCDYNIDRSWWSRPYEYKWASQFVGKELAVADMGCGFPHPFKYFLAEMCKKVYAVDVDPRVKNIELMHTNMEILIKSMCNTGIESESLDVVFCISVVEHVISTEFDKTLLEFSRILKPNGIVVMTVDIPLDGNPHRASYSSGWCTLEKFLEKFKKVFALKGDVNSVMPIDVLCNRAYNLAVFHCVGTKI